jgi:hypothetical protein
VDESTFPWVSDWAAKNVTLAMRKSWNGPMYGLRRPST